ncbi:hypothetical protein [Pseudoalteromonas rubra]|uniref:hypothetical protein n=1 Tax=Pseudoalteromonas rubra TaxID=43658 RepID=UPI002DC04984|nr:hypothetical protein [Pseudoalteromonas rubra]MEC4087943.1 hypothetical protein [Pseudoalteromonas rubra]
MQFIKDYKAKNNGNEPRESDLQPFNDLSMSDAQLEFYRSEATVLTQKFLSDVLKEDLKEREEYFSARVHSELSNIKPSHLLDIFKGALGSLLFVLITGILYFAVWSLSTSPEMVIEQIFDIQIIHNETAVQN